LGYPIPPWRRRCRPAFAVFLPSPSAGHLRIRLILSCASLLLQSLSSHRRPGADVRAPSMGFHPSSRCHRPESTGEGFPSPHRSVLDVSHVLDGFLLQPTSRVCFTPQPRPGFALQGFPRMRSRASSSLAVALVSLACRHASPSGPCSSHPSVARHGCLGHVLPAPLVSFILPRVFLRAP